MWIHKGEHSSDVVPLRFKKRPLLVAPQKTAEHSLLRAGGRHRLALRLPVPRTRGAGWTGAGRAAVSLPAGACELHVGTRRACCAPARTRDTTA